MNRMQPWLALKTLFGYDPTGRAPKLVKSQSLSRLMSGNEEYQGTLGAWYEQKMRLQTDRFQVYKSADDMDFDDIIVAALDLYADDAVQRDQSTGKSIWVESYDEEIEKFGNMVLDNVDAQNNIFAVGRELAKYGDSFSGLIQQRKDDGTPGPIIDTMAASVYYMTRVEDEDGRLIGWRVAPIEQSGQPVGVTASQLQEHQNPTDPPWSFIHWRMLGKYRLSRYGTSFIAPATRAYRRLRMAEDALVIYRLRRSPDRFVFALKGMAGLSVEERLDVLNRVRKEMRKNQLYDKDTQKVRADMNPMNPDEDFIIDEEAISVTRLAGSTEVNHVYDIDYLRKRLFGILKIPADYMGFDDAKSGLSSETPLSYQDVNFARMEKRLQNAVMEGYALMIQMDMCWRGINPADERAQFTLHMNPVSGIDEKQRLELEQVRAETLETLTAIGELTGVDAAKWQEYIIQRAQLPKHLLRKDGKSKGIITGQVEITSSTSGNAPVLGETDMRGIDDKLTGLPTERRVELARSLFRARQVFEPSLGPNTHTPRKVDWDGLMPTQENVSMWESKSGKEYEGKPSDNLMEQTVALLKRQKEEAAKRDDNVEAAARVIVEEMRREENEATDH